MMGFLVGMDCEFDIDYTRLYNLSVTSFVENEPNEK
jgi:hypothetical protein